MIACVHHLDPPVLGDARAALAEGGAPVVEVFRPAGDPLLALAGVQGIVTLGGAESVLDLDADPVLAEEGRWLARAVAGGIPVLGVCLGAQLLAHVLGGRVFRLPRRNVAWFALEPTAGAEDDPLLGELPPGAHGLHWNEDGFAPPPGAVELLRRGGAGDAGPGCLAFRAGSSAWGIQFHPEVDGGALEHWYAAWQPALAQAGVTEAEARAADAGHLPGQAALVEAVFGRFARLAAGYPTARA